MSDKEYHKKETIFTAPNCWLRLGKDTEGDRFFVIEKNNIAIVFPDKQYLHTILEVQNVIWNRYGECSRK